MNKRNLFALTTMLGLCSANFISVNPASAQMSSETQQLIDEINFELGKMHEYIQHTEQQRQQQMNALGLACNDGDSNACMEYQLMINAEIRAIDNYIDTSRNRRLCGSPFCN